MKQLFIFDTNTTRYQVSGTPEQAWRIARKCQQQGLMQFCWIVPAFKSLPSGKFPGQCAIGELA